MGQVTLNYGKANVTNKSATPLFHNIRLEDVRCEKGVASYFLDGLEEQHIVDLSLQNVTMASAVGREAACTFVECTCDELSTCPSCCQRRTGSNGQRFMEPPKPTAAPSFSQLVV